MSTASIHDTTAWAQTLGDRIWKARKTAGLSQGQLGKAIGRDRKTISAWEDDRVVPARGLITAIAVATGAPRDWLLDGTEPGRDGGPGPDGAGASDKYAPWDSNPEPADSVTSLTTWRDRADTDTKAA